MIAQRSHYEIVGQLYRSFKRARENGTIPAETPYLPVIEKRYNGTRTVYCADKDGKRIEAVGSVEVEVSPETIKRDMEDELLANVLAEQIKDMAAETQAQKSKAAIVANEPFLWVTWGECANDIFLMVAGAAILWFAWHIDWKLVVQHPWQHIVGF